MSSRMQDVLLCVYLCLGISAYAMVDRDWRCCRSCCTHQSFLMVDGLCLGTFWDKMDGKQSAIAQYICQCGAASSCTAMVGSDECGNDATAYSIIPAERRLVHIIACRLFKLAPHLDGSMGHDTGRDPILDSCRASRRIHCVDFHFVCQVPFIPPFYLATMVGIVCVCVCVCACMLRQVE